MFSFILALILAFTPRTYAWNVEKFTNLVVFGDSWSDAGRLHYFISHNGSVPPVGWIDDGVCSPQDIFAESWYLTTV